MLEIKHQVPSSSTGSERRPVEIHFVVAYDSVPLAVELRDERLPMLGWCLRTSVAGLHRNSAGGLRATATGPCRCMPEAMGARQRPAASASP